MQNIKHQFTKFVCLWLALSWLPAYGASVSEKNTPIERAHAVRENIEWVVSLDPEIDAYESINNKDFRLIGYYPSHMTNLPFIPKDHTCKSMIWKVDSGMPRIVSGPSFQGRKESNLELINKFDDYLIKYNSIMQNYLIETGKAECDS